MKERKSKQKKNKKSLKVRKKKKEKRNDRAKRGSRENLLTFITFDRSISIFTGRDVDMTVHLPVRTYVHGEFVSGREGGGKGEG